MRAAARGHRGKVLAMALAIEGASLLAYAAGRLAGYDVLRIVDRACFARTPAQFWRRYNRMVGEWLHRNVYLRVGPRRRPGRAALITFLVSGLLHELLFAIATLEVRGYQVAFFLLQGAAVVLSARLDRRLRRSSSAARFAAWLGTALFVLASSVLFFASLDQASPGFYASAPWVW